jgi:DNA-binding NarL/FixJ family response regulator
MSGQKRILIVEDQRLVREGLRLILSSADDCEIVGEAENGLEAIRLCDNLEPDLILMDLSMPKMSGLEAIREIKSLDADVKVLAVTVHRTEEHVLEAFDAGADGYALKHSGKDELLMAIRSVLSGERFISPMVSGQVIQGYLEGARSLKQSSSWDTLTSRERQVLKLIAEGYKNKDIADYLCISVKTVETHRSNIMKKLDIHNASELTAYAMQRGLVTT